VTETEGENRSPSRESRNVRDASGRQSPFAVLILQASGISKVPPEEVVSNDRQPLPRAHAPRFGMIAKSARERDNRHPLFARCAS
jgi:hypothetical protein